MLLIKINKIVIRIIKIINKFNSLVLNNFGQW